MSMAFLEKNKVLLSLAAVLLVGGVLLASTFEGISDDGLGSEQIQEQDPADKDVAQVAEGPAEPSGWATSTSFDEMVDDQPFSDPIFEDAVDEGGFAETSRNEEIAARQEQRSASSRSQQGGAQGTFSGSSRPVFSTRPSASPGIQADSSRGTPVADTDDD